MTFSGARDRERVSPEQGRHPRAHLGKDASHVISGGSDVDDSHFSAAAGYRAARYVCGTDSLEQLRPPVPGASCRREWINARDADELDLRLGRPGSPRYDVLSNRASTRKNSMIGDRLEDFPGELSRVVTQELRSDSSAP